MIIIIDLWRNQVGDKAHQGPDVLTCALREVCGWVGGDRGVGKCLSLLCKISFVLILNVVVGGGGDGNGDSSISSTLL